MKGLVKQIITSVDEYYSTERLKEAFFLISKSENEDTVPEIVQVYIIGSGEDRPFQTLKCPFRVI